MTTAVKTFVRYVAALIAALVVSCAAFFVGFILHPLLGVTDVFIPRNRFLSDWMDLSRATGDFGLLLVCALSIVPGIIVFIAVTRLGRQQRLRTLAYSLLWLVLIPASFYNFAHADMLMSFGAQAVADLVMVFLSLIILTELWKFQLVSVDAQILRGIAIFLLLFAGVLIPAIYAGIWILFELGAVHSIHYRPSVEWVSAAGGIVSAAVAVLNYFRPPTNLKRSTAR